MQYSTEKQEITIKIKHDIHSESKYVQMKWYMKYVLSQRSVVTV
jgi:hypothetical protein